MIKKKTNYVISKGDVIVDFNYHHNNIDGVKVFNSFLEFYNLKKKTREIGF